MNPFQVIKSSFLLVAAIFTLGSASHVTAAERPNVILILSDDQGFTNYGFMGHPKENNRMKQP